MDRTRTARVTMSLPIESRFVFFSSTTSTTTTNNEHAHICTNLMKIGILSNRKSVARSIVCISARKLLLGFFRLHIDSMNKILLGDHQ